MAISYPLSLPSGIAARSVVLGTRSVVTYQRGPYTLQGQSQVHQGMLWEGQFTAPPHRRADVEVLLAFLTALNGEEGTFLLGPADLHPEYALMGVGAAMPLVKGAGQTGRTLVADGFANSTLVLKAGDYLGLGSGSTSRLHKALQDVTSDGSGAVSIPIWPRLRESPADNAVINLTNPKGVFKLASNTNQWGIDHQRVIQTGFAFEEAI